MSKRTFLKISKSALLANTATIRHMAGETKVVAVIKADAYGHGQNTVAKALQGNVDYFQVDSVTEAVKLRQVTKKPILIFGYVIESELPAALATGAILSAFSYQHAQMMDRAAKKSKMTASVYIAIDALLGREGVLLEELDQTLERIRTLKNISVKGFYAHFADIEDDPSLSHARKQMKVFESVIRIFESHGYKNVTKHISASSGTVFQKLGDVPLYDAVRSGIALYGMWPSKSIKDKMEKRGYGLVPALTWVSSVAQVKTLPKGRSVSYGLTYVTPKSMKVAVIPVGYSDGYDRRFSNKGEVLIGGKRCKVLGRVCMNMMVVDVSRIKNVKIGDEVVLLGRQGKEGISAEDLGKVIGTINYEITTRINPLLERIIVK